MATHLDASDWFQVLLRDVGEGGGGGIKAGVQEHQVVGGVDHILHAEQTTSDRYEGNEPCGMANSCIPLFQSSTFVAKPLMPVSRGNT